MFYLFDVFADDLDGKDTSGPDSFYKVYEPVFERNKRFAVILPAPSLGDDDTPIDEVRGRVCCRRDGEEEDVTSSPLRCPGHQARAGFVPVMSGVCESLRVSCAVDK